MPSSDHPGYYERADFTAAGYADDFVRWLLADPDSSFVAETGHVEAPIGYVALAKITGEMISEYVTDQGDPWMSEPRNFSLGWYIVRQDNNGLIWAIGYGGDCDLHPGELCADTAAEEAARADFAEAEAAYGLWEELSEGEV